MARLDGKSTLIVGAAGKDNMGQVIARRFADEGARVMVAGRHEDVLKTLADEIGGAYVVGDFTKKADILAMVDATVSAFGGIDVAINATGWGLLKSLTDTTDEDLEQMIDLQFKGPFWFLQALVEAMKDKGGSIIQVSSATATIMLENHMAYMGTKAGIDHVVRCVANEYGKYGIRANSVSPGITESPMTAQAFESPALIDAFTREYPLGRVGTSEDIAAACVWLASDECFMTGQNLQINGGLTLRRNPTNAEIMAAVKGG